MILIEINNVISLYNFMFLFKIWVILTHTFLHIYRKYEITSSKKMCYYFPLTFLELWYLKESRRISEAREVNYLWDDKSRNIFMEQFYVH